LRIGQRWREDGIRKWQVILYQFLCPYDKEKLTLTEKNIIWNPFTD